MKRILSLVLLVSFLFALVPQGLRAEPSISSEDAKMIAVSKLRGFENALENNYRGQYGLLYNLYYITMYAHWVEFVNKVEFADFTKEEKDGYRERLYSKMEEFNTSFKEAQGFKPLVLTVNKASIKETMKSLVDVSIPEYVKGLLTDISKEMREGDSDEVLEDNREVIRYAYRVIDVLVNEKGEMQKIVPDPNTNLSTLTFSVNARGILFIDEFSELLQKGRSLTEQETADLGSVSYEERPTFIEQLAYVKKKEGAAQGAFGEDIFEPLEGFEGEGDQVRLRDTYVAMIAATGIYRPFQSYVGDKDYMRSLQSLVGENNYESIERLFNNIKDYRKPLYTIENVGWWEEAFGDATVDEASFPTYSGEGKPLTIANFLERIEEETISGFVTIKGDFGKAKDDTNSWAFFRSNQGVLAGYGSSEVVAEVAQPVTQPATQPTGPTQPEEEPVTIQTGVAAVDTTSAEQSSNGTGSVIAIAGKETSTTEWTSSLFEFGAKGGQPITGLALMKNLLNAQKELIDIPNKESRYLFINAIGDIVTDDNLVVVPAAANPMLYNETLGYNPYTVAFMNGYPGVYVSGKDKLNVSNERDHGKYLLLGEAENAEAENAFIKIQGKSNLAVTQFYNPIRIYKESLDVGQGDNPMLELTTAKVPGFWDTLYSAGSLGKMTAFARASYGANGAPLFPYSPEMDTDGRIAAAIVKNLYWSYKNSGKEVTANFNGRLKEDFIFDNILVSGMGGSIYALSYTKNITENFDNMTDSMYGGMTKAVAGFTKDILGSFGKVTGVLGLKDRYSDPILSKVLVVAEDYIWYILLGVGLVILVNFLRQRISLLYTIAMIVLSVTIVFSFIKILPVYLPKAYNIAVNNISKNLSYQILMTKAEKYVSTYGESGQLDDDGNFKVNTTSFNIYRLDDGDLQQLADRYGISTRDLKSGKSFIVDSEAGLFIEGDSLKVNTDLLFSTNPITGEYTTEKQYQFVSKKMHSSALDYYTPYYQIQDGFIDSLNNLLKMYSIPRQTAAYAKGLNKDSYAVYSFINSAPFLTPESIGEASDDILPEEAEKFKALFDTPEDFLGIHEMLSNPTPEMEETLWYKTLLANGFLDKTEQGEKLYNNLVYSVNYLTKKFIIDMKPQVGLVSDENLIKIIALHASTIFSQKVGEPFNFLYPVSLNYQEYSLEDVYLAAFTNDYNRFISSDMDVVDYVATSSGIPGLLFLMANITLGALLSVLLSASISILFLVFLVLIFVKLLGGSSIKVAAKGYAKVSLLLFVCLTSSVLVLSITSVTGMGWLSLAIIFIVYLVILFVVCNVISSVMFNLTDMGNAKLGEKFDNLANNMKLGNVIQNLKVHTTSLYRGVVDERQRRLAYENAERYGLDRAMSDNLVDDSRTYSRVIRNVPTRAEVELSKEEILEEARNRKTGYLDNYKL